MSEQMNIDELKIDTASLWLEETYSDLRVGSIRKLTPVTADGSRDHDREPLFIGQTQLMSQMGPIPVQAALEARSLAEALEKFPQVMNDAVTSLLEEAKELRRREAGRIVHPSEIQGPGPRIIE